MSWLNSPTKIKFSPVSRQSVVRCVHKIAKATNRFFMSVCPSVRLSVCPSAWNNSTSTEQIFILFDIYVVFEKLSRKFKFHYNRTRMKGTLHEDQYIFLIISRSSLLRMRNDNKSSRGNQNSHFVLSNYFLMSCHL